MVEHSYSQAVEHNLVDTENCPIYLQLVVVGAVVVAVVVVVKRCLLLFVDRRLAVVQLVVTECKM